MKSLNFIPCIRLIRRIFKAIQYLANKKNQPRGVSLDRLKCGRKQELIITRVYFYSLLSNSTFIMITNELC